jgi:hypothetical protein
MQIANLLPQKIASILIPAIASTVLAQPLPQSDPPKDKPPAQEKKSDEKKTDITAQRGGFEILSDNMGVDFGPYMRRLRSAVQGHWNALIPEVALPPLSKSGTVTIELSVMKNGQVSGMKPCEIIWRMAVGSGRLGRYPQFHTIADTASRV